MAYVGVEVENLRQVLTESLDSQDHEEHGLTVLWVVREVFAAS